MHGINLKDLLAQKSVNHSLNLGLCYEKNHRRKKSFLKMVWKKNSSLIGQSRHLKFWGQWPDYVVGD